MKRPIGSAKRRLAGALVVSCVLLVPLGVFGSSAVARTMSAVGQYGHHSGASQYQYRVGVCHHTGSRKHPWHLITISSAAVPAHLRHGDQMPPCLTTVPRFHHGHSSDHKSDGQLSGGSHRDDDDDDDGGQGHGHHGRS
jgi:hypothetical protein